MSDNKSWKKLYQSYTEPAIEEVRDCVAALRSRGLKTDAALQDLAPLLGVTPRRVRTLFHNDGTPIVLKNEWLNLRYRVGLFWLNQAEHLRRLADIYEERGNERVSTQMEFAWSEKHTNTAQRRCA